MCVGLCAMFYVHISKFDYVLTKYKCTIIFQLQTRTPFPQYVCVWSLIWNVLKLVFGISFFPSTSFSLQDVRGILPKRTSNRFFEMLLILLNRDSMNCPPSLKTFSGFFFSTFVKRRKKEHPLKKILFESKKERKNSNGKF